MCKRVNQVTQSCRDGERFRVLERSAGDVGAVQLASRVSVASEQRARDRLIC